MPTISNIKSDFSLYNNNSDFVYLDSASTTLIPKITVDAVNDFLSSNIISTRRGTYKLAVQGIAIVKETRSTLSEFLQTDKSQISFQKSISSAIASFAYGYDWQTEEKNKIVVAESEEHSIFVALLRVAEILQLHLTVVPINKNGELNIEKLKSAVDSETGIVAVGHVPVGLGIQNPVDECAKIAHENGALLLSDITRSIGFTKESPISLQADLLVFSANIGLMGPPGLAIQWINQSIKDKHIPGILGSSAIDQVKNTSYKISSSPDKFESGILNIPAIKGLKSSIEYLQNLKNQHFDEHMITLGNYMNNRLSEIPNIVMYGTHHNQRTIFGFNLGVENSINCHDVALFLDESNIAVRSGFLCAHPLIERIEPKGIIQASLHVYNSIDDIDHFTDVLHTISRQLM
ncbi:MAG: aminotransferase class V-fold PLP-dependent enzyme [Candidatus Thorarchaeota archaeon]|jgi:cysteine desulfurase/selenocysteine lyase